MNNSILLEGIVTKMSHHKIMYKLRAVGIFSNLGPGLCFAALLIALNIYIFSFPGIGIGFWPQSELPAAVLHICGLLAAAGLMFIFWRSRIVERFFFHPGVLLPLAIALTSLLFWPLHDLPVRHLLGSPLTGEGVAWWLDWAVLSCACLILCQIPFYRKALAVFGLLSMAAVYVLTISHVHLGHPYTPLFYPDFLGIILLSAIPMSAALIRPEKFSLKIWLAIYVLLNLLILPTHNYAAMIFAGAGFGILILLQHEKSLKENFKIKLYHIGIVAVPLMIIIFLAGFSWLPIQHGYYAFLDQGALITIISRAYLTEVVMNQLYAEPFSWIAGLGWGSYEEQLARNLPTEWLDLTKIGYEQWDGLFQDHFHSHNIFIEALYAGGILSFLFIFLYFLSFYILAKKSLQDSALIYCSGIIFLGSFWFFMPLNVAFIILGACLLFKRSASLDFSAFQYKRHVVFLMLLVCMVFQGFAAYATYDTARVVNLYYPENHNIKTAQLDCKMDYRDHGAGGMHLSKIMLERLRYINAEAERLTKEPEKSEEVVASIRDEVQRINHLFCQTDIYIAEHRPSIRLSIARLLVRGEILLAHAGHLDEETKQYYYNGWQADLISWLGRYPQRTDQAIPYLLWHFNNGEETAVKDMAQKILQRNGQDPVGLWFYGLCLTAEPSEAPRGISMMRRALEGGMDRLMPIEEELKKQLGFSPSSG